MAKSRVINTRFWSDGFVRTKLNPLDRYVFLYFLTNERTNICGAYELPLEIVASETGIERETLLKMMPRFEGKIYYEGDWVVMPNFIKHQTLNPSVLAGIKREYNILPKVVKDRLYTDWVQLGLLNLTKLNLTKPNGVDNDDNDDEELEVPETINQESWNSWVKYRSERKLPAYKPKGLKSQWNFLSSYSKGDQSKIIETSIRNNWQGLFELKEKAKKGGTVTL